VAVDSGDGDSQGLSDYNSGEVIPPLTACGSAS